MYVHLLYQVAFRYHGKRCFDFSLFVNLSSFFLCYYISYSHFYFRSAFIEMNHNPNPFISTMSLISTISSAFREVFHFDFISPFIITTRTQEKVVVRHWRNTRMRNCDLKLLPVITLTDLTPMLYVHKNFIPSTIFSTGKTQTRLIEFALWPELQIPSLNFVKFFLKME